MNVKAVACVTAIFLISFIEVSGAGNSVPPATGQTATNISATATTSDPAIMRAEAETKLKRAEVDLHKSEADFVKAWADATREPVDYMKARNAQQQYYFDLVFRVLIFIVVVWIVIVFLPRIQEFTFSLGGNSATVTTKLPASASTPEPEPPTTAVAALKETVEAGAVAPSVLTKAAEAVVYDKVGIAPDSVYLVHKATRIRGSNYWRLQINVDADDSNVLNQISHVRYILHPTFKQPERTRTSAADQFELKLTAWGEFLIRALVYFEGQEQPVELKRYLNF